VYQRTFGRMACEDYWSYPTNMASLKALAAIFDFIHKTIAPPNCISPND